MSREINLLPKSRREALRQAVALLSSLRFLQTILTTLLVATGGAVMLAGGLWSASVVSDRATTAELTEEIVRYQQVRDDIAEQNLFLQYVDTIDRQRVVWSEVLPRVFAAVPPGAAIELLSARQQFDHGAIDQISLRVVGQATSRASVIALQEALKEVPEVVEVQAPNTNLLNPTNPSYEFTLIFNDEEGRDAKRIQEL